MSEFKVGDKVWCSYDDGSCNGQFWGLGEDGPEVIKRIEPYKEGGPDMLFFDDGPGPTAPEIAFHTRKEALSEAIRRNEALASDLTLEIARLKEELASCKDSS